MKHRLNARVINDKALFNVFKNERYLFGLQYKIYSCVLVLLQLLTTVLLTTEIIIIIKNRMICQCIPILIFKRFILKNQSFASLNIYWSHTKMSIGTRYIHGKHSIKHNYWYLVKKIILFPLLTSSKAVQWKGRSFSLLLRTSTRYMIAISSFNVATMSYFHYLQLVFSKHRFR